MKEKIFVLAMIIVFILNAVSAAVGPSCDYSKIEENSNFIIQGEIIEVKILNERTEGEDEFYTKFALVEVKIRILNVIKGDKNIGDEINFSYETILEDTGGWAGGVYYNLYDVGNLVEYRDVESVIGLEENPCMAAEIIPINSISPTPEPVPESNNLIYYIVGTIVVIAVIVTIIKLKK